MNLVAYEPESAAAGGHLKGRANKKGLKERRGKLLKASSQVEPEQQSWRVSQKY